MTTDIHQRTPANKVYAMHAYYMDGHSMQATGTKYGVTANCVYKCFRRHNLHIRTKAHSLRLTLNLEAETRAMYADYQAGMSHSQIAAKYHYSASAIGQRFRSYGYKSRSVREARYYEIAS